MWDEAGETCKLGGYDGMLELRYEEDATFVAKILYCGWEFIKTKQPGK